MATDLVMPRLGIEMTEGTIIEWKKVDKHLAAVELGRLGGLKGSKARASKLTTRTEKRIGKESSYGTLE